MREFETLVFHPYTGGKQRYRRFSSSSSGSRMASGVLSCCRTARSFSPKATTAWSAVSGVSSRLSGSILRRRWPRERAQAYLDEAQRFQINVHQVRVIASADIKGIAVPKGRTAMAMTSL